MAVDWILERHVPTAQRPADHEYSRFERCCADYGRLLDDHYKSEKLHNIKTLLDQLVFIPGEKLGIGVSKLCLEIQSFFYICRHCFPLQTAWKHNIMLT